MTARSLGSLLAWAMLACGRQHPPPPSVELESTTRAAPRSTNDVADAGAAQGTPSTPAPENPRLVPSSERSDAATSIEDAARITIAPKHQIFTTADPPGHVWFDVTSTGPSAMEIIGLTYDGDAGPIRLPVRAIRLGGVERKGRILPVEAGVTMLELDFDYTRLPSGLQSHRFLLEARANGAKLSAATVVSFAHRDPIRR